MRAAIIADDLTGAADTAAQFARAGYRAAVLFHDAPILREDFDAVAVNTDSRPLDPEEAAGRVRKTTDSLKHASIVYKKLDSTLRGPVAAELAAALEASGRKAAVVAPAFPGAGRTTRDGVQLAGGVPVHEAEPVGNLRTPARGAHVPSLLAAAGPEPVGTLGVGDLSDAVRVGRVVGDHGWVVADAEEDAHLEVLVRAVPDPSAVLWAGSAGLALALGRVYPRVHPEPRADRPSPGREPARRVLVVIGSRSNTAREQRHRLAAAPGARPVELVLPPGPRTVAEATEEARAALLEGEHVVLYPAGAAVAAAGRIVGALAAVAAALSEEKFFDALVLTGGDTAEGVSRELGARGLVVEGELAPGVVAGALLGPRPYRVVTKAGGFGGPDALLDAVRALSG